MSIAPTLPASTVVLLRSGAAAVEVFLVRRHDAIAFMGGAHVFPGGRVDQADYIAEPEALCEGVPNAIRRMPGIPAAVAIAFHVAAVRELFEEAGVLLAADATGTMAVIPDERLSRYRQELIGGRTTLAALAATEKLRLSLDRLMLFGHWVTPDSETRRFDTRFFLAIAPGSQEALHDAHEATDGLWLAPAEAIARCERGEIALPPPTWTTLRALSRCSTPEDAWQWARASTVPRIQPSVVERDGARLIMLPGDPEYPAVPGFHAEEPRFVLKDGRWLPVGVD